MNMKRVVLIFALMVAVLPLAAQNGGSILGKYRKALIIGAHPDDPEYCCGGTALMLQRTGCEVVNVYLTGGEAGIPGKSGDEAKAIRQKEISDACAIMGVRHVQLTQVDGACEITKERYAEMKTVIEREKPDVVFTHWPIDSHRDHRICGILTYDAWRQLGHSFDLYYHEAMTGCKRRISTPTPTLTLPMWWKPNTRRVALTPAKSPTLSSNGTYRWSVSTVANTSANTPKPS